jgi:TatD DNase family protein
MFVDIHTHNAPVSDTVAIRNLSFSEAEALYNSEKEGFFSVGYHPWSSDEFTEESFSFLEKWTSNRRFIAIGECGLDKNSKVSLSIQFQVFEKQIALSEKIHKPLIIHCVGCFNELSELRKQLNPHQIWIIHGFRSKHELAAQILKTGCFLSFGEFFNDESVRITPIDRLFIETDESSVPIEEIYKRIATVKGCRAEDLSAGMSLIKKIEKSQV